MTTFRPPSNRILAVLALAAPWIAAAADADVLNVPADYPTITDAIAAASAGDVVEIAAGTYVERINSDGKAIRIRGAVDGGGNPITILDGSAGGSVFTADSGEQYDTVVENLLLTNGLAYRGGGAYVDFGSRVLFENCHFIDNEAQWGGGFCSWASHLRGCRVEGNATSGNYPFNASGVLRFDGISGGTLRVEDCVITGNGTPGQITYAVRIYGAGRLDMTGTTVCGNLNRECYGFECDGDNNYVDEECLPPACPPTELDLSVNSSLALDERGNRCECYEPAGDFFCGSYAGEWAVVYDLSAGETSGSEVEINCVKYGTSNTDGAVSGAIHFRVDPDGGEPEGDELVDLVSIPVNIPSGTSVMNLLPIDPPIVVPFNTRLVVSLEADWAFNGYLSIRGNAASSESRTYYRDPQTFCSSGFNPLADLGYPDVNWVTELGVDLGERPCPADFNGDGRVDGADLPVVLSEWGACGGGCSADLDGNDLVDGADLSQVLAAWGPCVEPLRRDRALRPRSVEAGRVRADDRRSDPRAPIADLTSGPRTR